MGVNNGYATITEFKNYADISSTDATDDLVIADILESASRFIDGQMIRAFYPRIETRYYNVPSGRDLWLDDDLLACTTLTNGDDDSIANTEYNLMPRNIYPKYAIKLTEITTEYFTSSDDGETEGVIEVLGEWGYHGQYSQRGWTSAGTLGAAIATAAATTFTMTAGHSLEAAGGQIIKIDSEIMIVSSISTNTVTPIRRGDNGSTAAAHDDKTTVYAWNVMDEIKQASLALAQSIYKRRFGENLNSISTITAGGVVITPQDVPGITALAIKKYRRML